MYKKQMTLQRVACLLSLAAAALVFIYSLGLVTDLHYNNFAYYAENLEKPKVEGSQLFYEIQPFNSQLTTAGIVLILSALLLFVFGRREWRWLSKRKTSIDLWLSQTARTLRLPL